MCTAWWYLPDLRAVAWSSRDWGGGVSQSWTRCVYWPTAHGVSDISLSVRTLLTKKNYLFLQNFVDEGCFLRSIFVELKKGLQETMVTNFNSWRSFHASFRSRPEQKFYVTIFTLTENLSPAELKKLKNKQRKRAKQEAMKKEKQRQEEQQKQTQKPKNQDADLDGPKEEELVPDKLARVRKLIVWQSQLPKMGRFSRDIVFQRNTVLLTKELVVAPWSSTDHRNVPKNVFHLFCVMCKKFFFFFMTDGKAVRIGRQILETITNSRNETNRNTQLSLWNLL